MPGDGEAGHAGGRDEEGVGGAEGGAETEVGGPNLNVFSGITEQRWFGELCFLLVIPKATEPQENQSRPRALHRRLMITRVPSKSTVRTWNSTISVTRRTLKLTLLLKRYIKPNKKHQRYHQHKNIASQVLSDIDKTLDEGNYRQVEDVLEELGNLILEYPKNPELLWRLGKAHHLATKQHANDRETRRDHANKGVEACLESISLNPNIAEAHKWLAILVGSRSENQPIKERLADGQLFKQHLDIALRLKPEDYILHHMLGRYAYEIAGLKWYVGKIICLWFFHARRLNK